jgi:hypothetical protein
MLAVAFRCGTRMLVGALAVMVCAGAAVPGVLGNAAASGDKDERAARLLRLDPAARVGGNTQVATPAGAGLVGVPGRVNFMLGLARRQQIVGGNGHDQLGARGHGARVHEAVRAFVCEAEATGFMCQSGSRSPKWILRPLSAAVQW